MPNIPNELEGRSIAEVLIIAFSEIIKKLLQNSMTK